MTRKLVTVVEGHSEQEAVPALLRAGLASLGEYEIDVLPGFRVSKSKLVRESDTERLAISAVRKRGADMLFILVDADDDKECELGPTLLARASNALGDLPVRCTVAVREIEGWILASLDLLGGVRGIPLGTAHLDDHDSISDAKGRLREITGSYVATRDLPALCSSIDVNILRSRSKSFDKFMRDLEFLIASGNNF